ncbi:PREDICTED: neuronal acetylcholine receptor subunit alpha-10-like [Branchiostoma belcheri]|uniref:Neuronal acetylcholine receptor subunit alpha-10-like n=1 Tax=Branchiostoma belcheri TaxID=7741 RepID=A0A6P5A3T2_BRABE|nr:PREDICTED: neuronal acetylcholine receptor subunit alpha-10-like [Branchiostoma belcheri]
MRTSVAIIVLATLIIVPEIRCQQVAEALKTHLLTGYDKYLRPVTNSSQKIDVTFGVGLRQIIDLKEKEQTFRINVWLRLFWTDYLLQWNASDWGGVTSITVHSSEIWRPDVFLYNNIGDSYGNVEEITSITVQSTGSISYYQPGIFESACPVHVGSFPFDTQECELEFGSWIYHGFVLDFHNSANESDQSSYIPNEEFVLTSSPLRKKVGYYSCCPEPYPSMVINFYLQRRSFFYIFNMVLPCIILMVLNWFGFYIPPDSGERLGFFMTILLALVVFLQVLADILPKTSQTTPLLGVFFAATIGLVGFSCLVSIVIIRLSCNSPPTRPVPRWVHVVLLHGLARLFCMTSIYNEDNMVKVSPTGGVAADDLVVERVVSNGHVVNGDVDSPYPTRVTNGRRESVNDQSVLTVLRGLNAQVTKHFNTLGEKATEEGHQDDWKMVALVLDRFFLWVVGAGTIAVIVCLFFVRY